VAAFTYEQKILAKYSESLKAPTRAGLRFAQMIGLMMGFGQFCMFAAYTLTFWYGGKLIDENEADFLDVITVFMSVLLSAMALGQTASIAPNISKAKQAAATIFKLIDEVPEIDSFSTEGKQLSDVRGDIEFRDVSFAYPQRPDAKVFDGMSLKIKAGQVVALVGQSGSGKSTCVALLERFYNPLSGSILIDGEEIKDLNVRWLRQQVLLSFALRLVLVCLLMFLV
jgi:ATP-binding cassette subfamily B (MDR/TAP) protein 1